MHYDTKIILPPHIHHQMLTYARLANGEISGLAKTTIRKVNGILEVVPTVCKIFRQEVTSVRTTLNRDHLSDFYYRLDQEDEDQSKWNLWWHSHHTFDVFWSETDETAISKLNFKNLYSICINKKGDIIGRQDGTMYGHKTLPVEIDAPISPAIIQECNDNIQKLVTYKHEITTTYAGRLSEAVRFDTFRKFKEE